MTVLVGSIQHAVKDNAWFTANAALVLELGRVVFKSGTLTFVRGDNVTALSALPIYDCSGSGSVSWGTIGGTLSSQIDLNNRLTAIDGDISSLDTSLGSHTSNTSNPHSTTLAQALTAGNSAGAKITDLTNGTNPGDAVNRGQLDLKQDQLNGTGFVKVTGTTVSYDNSSYIVENTITNYTPTWTGFSTNPTVNAGDAVYIVRGKFCKVRVRPASGGTSNSTALTITLPFTSATTNNPQIFTCIIQNNGTVSNNPGRIDVASNSNIATVYINNQQGAFTASGTKSVFFDIEYQLP